MSEKINGRIRQYVIIQSVVRSAIVCLVLTILSGGIAYVLKEDGFNVIFIDQLLIMSIGLNTAFDVQSMICGKSHVFVNCRKRIFKMAMQSALVSAFVYALWRTACQNILYEQYVMEFMEDEVEPIVLTRLPVPELFVSNFIFVLAVCIILLWRFGMGRDYGILYLEMNKTEWSAQMQYLTALRKKRLNILGKIGRLAYWAVEFILLVAVMVCSSYLYYFQLQAGISMRIGIYVGVLMIGVIFFLLTKHRFRPEYM